MAPIKIGVIGIGNCASSLLQGITYYRRKKPDDAIGILNWSINGYTPGDIQVVSAFDIDERKVGKDVHQAVFEPASRIVFLSALLPAAVGGVYLRRARLYSGGAVHVAAKRSYDRDWDLFHGSDGA